MFDFSALTLGEVAFIEDLSGRSIASLTDEAPQGKFLAALATVVKRRTGTPDFKFNDGLALSLTEAQDLLGLNDPDPDEDSDEGKDEHSDVPAKPTKRSSSSTSE